ncbi:MAG: HNH endonuclease [Clostridiales bacterium]|nr:HNH endonuclease [Clostridiales bacterium]
MIRIERRQTEKSKKAVESLNKARLNNTSYNTPEVNVALREMFYGKCYICENKEVISYQIEHFILHRGDADLKYDWNNLFLSCAHCNNTKLDQFDPILNCTTEDVEKSIAFRKKGYFGIDEEFTFEELDSRTETKNTAELLRKVYYGSTPQKKMEASILRRILRKELSKFKEYVREYQEAEDEDKKDLKCLVEMELEDSSPFAAFKRWLIRDNKDTYPEFLEYIEPAHNVCHE